MASAALLLAASQIDRLDWAAQMVGMDDRMAALAVRAWKCNREVVKGKLLTPLEGDRYITANRANRANSPDLFGGVRQ